MESVTHFEDRRIAGVLVRIDRTLCCAFETCIDLAPEVFRFDDGGVVTFTGNGEAIMRDRLVEACRSCPVDALSAFDESGQPLAP
jgi:ferredoxin